MNLILSWPIPVWKHEAIKLLGVIDECDWVAVSNFMTSRSLSSLSADIASVLYLVYMQCGCGT